MTDEEKAALVWLEATITDPFAYDSSKEAAGTLKALLAQPRLPETLGDELVASLWHASGFYGRSHREVAENILRVLREGLTPKKIVWRLRWQWVAADGQSGEEFRDEATLKEALWRERDGVWVADIRHRGVTRHLGHFATMDDAIAARKAAELELFGEFAPLQEAA
jgi:hypothetical protein